MENDEKIVRVESLDDFDRELARDGGEALEVPASLAEQVRALLRGRGHRGRDPGRRRGSARRGGRAMKHDEYHRQFADVIIEQIRQGTAPWQKPWGPGERVLPSNVDTGRSYAGGNSLHLAAVQQSRGYARRTLGNLPPDPGPGRPGPEGRAGHPHPLLPGPPEDRRHRRARAARQGQRRQARLPLRAPAQAVRPAVHRVQRRAGRRAPGPARAHGRAALEGPPER